MMGADDKKTLSRKKVIETLEDNEVLVGADVAAKLNLKDADSLELLGKNFTVTAVLPQTGTVDDSRIFAHLHTVQDLAKKGPVVNAIEIIGCCQEISAGLVEKLNRLLPDAKVVTVAQIAQSQIKINRMMSNLSLMFLVIIISVGGASIANYMYANVFERRRENRHLDGSRGADSRLVLKVFLLKALLLGAAGGIGGLRARLDFRLRARPRSWPAFGFGRCGNCRLQRSVFPSALRSSRVTSQPGEPPGSIPAPHSRRSDPC